MFIKIELMIFDTDGITIGNAAWDNYRISNMCRAVSTLKLILV